MRAGMPATAGDSTEVGAERKAEWLADYGDREAKWDRHRGRTETLADFLARADEFERWARRMHECSGLLRFTWCTDLETGAKRLKFESADFCHCRHCPVCQWRRTLMHQAKFLEFLPSVQAVYPKARWLFLTLTVPNCPVSSLGETLTAMSKGWQRLVKRQELKPVIGWVRTTEVTREKKRHDYAHPHFHVLMMVPTSWFGRHYVQHKRWAELWKEAMRLTESPIVDIRVVKGNLNDAANEVFKTMNYSLKMSEFGVDDDWILEYFRQVHHRRFVASGGVLKPVFRDREDADASSSEDDISVSAQLGFDWKKPERRYRRFPKGDRVVKGKTP